MCNCMFCFLFLLAVWKKSMCKILFEIPVCLIFCTFHDSNTLKHESYMNYIVLTVHRHCTTNNLSALLFLYLIYVTVLWNHVCPEVLLTTHPWLSVCGPVGFPLIHRPYTNCWWRENRWCDTGGSMTAVILLTYRQRGPGQHPVSPCVLLSPVDTLFSVTW